MPAITWDNGTAYDFFISLLVLHNAADFGLRPSWAAGVRQRISAPQREFLEQMYSFSGTGLEWVCSLPQPKDALDVLRLAADLEPSKRFETLVTPAGIQEDVRNTLKAISEHGSATATDRDFLKANYLYRGRNLHPAGMDNLVRAWTNLESCGDHLLAALQEFYRVFFFEEEIHLRPALETGLSNAREMAEHMKPDGLIESLSHGVRIEDLGKAHSLILAPSYWASPLVFHLRPKPNQVLVVFGVRSPMQSVVPGAGAPDLLVTSLKSLADPTRLRILRFLYREPLPPAELARRLRLRPPTVTHHLQALRLAGLVQITVNERNERRYAARLESLNELNLTLQEFLTTQDRHD